MKDSLRGVSGVYHSKIDRLAVGTVCGEQPHGGANHHLDSLAAGASRRFNRLIMVAPIRLTLPQVRRSRPRLSA